VAKEAKAKGAKAKGSKAIATIAESVVTERGNAEVQCRRRLRKDSQKQQNKKSEEYSRLALSHVTSRRPAFRIDSAHLKTTQMKTKKR